MSKQDLINNALTIITTKDHTHFSPADTQLLNGAAHQISQTALLTGLGLHHFKILIAATQLLSHEHSYNTLVHYAYQISTVRDQFEFTIGDWEMIRVAAERVLQSRSVLRLDVEDETMEEKGVVTAWGVLMEMKHLMLPGPQLGSRSSELHRLQDSKPFNHHQLPSPRTPSRTHQPRTPKPEPPKPSPSIISHSGSILSGIGAISGLTNMTGLMPENVSPTKQREIADLLNRHPRYFPKPPTMHTKGRLPRLPDLPAIGSYAAIDDALLPSRQADLRAEIDQRHRDHESVLRYLVENDGLMWKLKLKLQGL